MSVPTNAISSIANTLADRASSPSSNVTTFFPSSKEIGTGIQWVRENKVLAGVVAVATTAAVSVFTYLNTPEDRIERIVSWSRDKSNNSKDNRSKCTNCSCTVNDHLSCHVCDNSDISSSSDDDDETKNTQASPDWGWYVSTTPPSDFTSKAAPC